MRSVYQVLRFIGENQKNHVRGSELAQRVSKTGATLMGILKNKRSRFFKADMASGDISPAQTPYMGGVVGGIGVLG